MAHEEKVPGEGAASRPHPITWTFDADPTDFQLAAEALRMRLAGMFDPMLAVSTSRIDPLPHQLRAVYGEMLPKPGPLRFLLADDPGAGKTVMAGLYLKELLLRGDVTRALIVAPGGLVDQWQEELSEKFDLDFTILTREVADAAAESASDGNPFPEIPLLIARMDQLSRDEAWLEHLRRSEWDLVIVDEAHRMSASYTGNELSRTLRYRLGQELGAVTRHLLLMTATPHAGKDEDFQAFLALLDPDRFEGAYRRGVHPADTRGLMRRMVKEDLLTFEGRSLFPERIAQTVPYELSAAEQTLYEEVTRYVREQMNLADAVAAEGDARRRTTVGFALTVLQRRLASSPEAIYRSLERRTERLRRRRADLEHATPLERRVDAAVTVAEERGLEQLLSDPEEVDAEDAERFEEEVLDSATAARTVAELEVELAALADLTDLAQRVWASGTDRKWTELRALVQQAQQKQQARASGRDGHPAKLIVFTEHRDTLTYLVDRISTLLGNASHVVAIDGGTRRADRLAIRERFTNDPTCAVLIATDAAGEGLNLQAAHLMVNYDLPWNPNRIEQRFGRIHRIGQREVCRLWNLVASNTREGQVFERLLEKIEEQRRAYGGKVFDVLGEHAFGERPLRELLVEAVRYGDDPAVRARLDRVIDASVGHGVDALVRERSLATPDISLADLHQLRRDLDEARARRLQPHYVSRFFLAALRAAGGSVNRRERGRYEITRVPATLLGPRIAPRYARVCFDPELASPPDLAPAELLAPGHPLFDGVVTLTLERCGSALARGATLLDPDPSSSARLVVAIAEEVDDGEGNPVSRRTTFVAIDGDGAVPAGPAPYLDLVVPNGHEHDGVQIDPALLRDAVADARSSAWLHPGVAALATAWSVRDGLPAHRAEVQTRVHAVVHHTRTLATSRLNAQINHWYAESARLAEDQAAGRHVRLAPGTALQRAADLESRLERRLVSLDAQERLVIREPRVIGAALVVPLREVVGPDGVPSHAVDTSPTDLRAVAAVLRRERALGRAPEEQVHSNPGYDILSTRPDGSTLRIEVKGRVRGARDFHVSHTQVLTGLNAGDGFVLAMVEVEHDGDPSDDRVRYLYRPFDHLAYSDTFQAGLPLQWVPMWERGTQPR